MSTPTRMFRDDRTLDDETTKAARAYEADLEGMKEEMPHKTTAQRIRAAWREYQKQRASHAYAGALKELEHRMRENGYTEEANIFTHLFTVFQRWARNPSMREAGARTVQQGIIDAIEHDPPEPRDSMEPIVKIRGNPDAEVAQDA